MAGIFENATLTTGYLEGIALSEFQRLGILARKGDLSLADTLTKLLDYLSENQLDIVVDESCATIVAPRDVRTCPESQLGELCDLVISVGGDGTMLHAARLLENFDVRLLGINRGRLGFLTDLTPAQITEELDHILSGNYVEEQRFFLQCDIVRDGNIVASGNALNDVVVEKRNTARLIGFNTHIDGAFVHSQRADGIIVSTPTGSTAYALAAGGPIVHPALDAVVMVPVCPHSLTNRPLVVSNNSTIEISVDTDDVVNARVACDGADISPDTLAPSDRIVIRKSGASTRLIHPAKHDHYANLRAKLHWGTDLC